MAMSKPLGKSQAEERSNSGTVWDGDFGPGTESQVRTFQQDYMNMAQPTGQADRDTLNTVQEFANEFPVNFDALTCKCGTCSGFGQNRFNNEYRPTSLKLRPITNGSIRASTKPPYTYFVQLVFTAISQTTKSPFSHAVTGAG
jgi:hypothetical protein